MDKYGADGDSGSHPFPPRSFSDESIINDDGSDDSGGSSKPIEIRFPFTGNWTFASSKANCSANDDIITWNATDDLNCGSSMANATVPDRSGPMPMLVRNTPYSVPIYGVVSPPVVLLTVVTNTLVCLVLLRRPAMRTPTNALLAALAVSDALTGLCPLPCFVYFFTFGRYREWVPYRWCALYPVLTDHLPTVFHTASIWLTVALAAHRYVCVCRPQVSKRWCTINNVIRTTVIVYVTATVIQLTRFIEMNYRYCLTGVLYVYCLLILLFFPYLYFVSTPFRDVAKQVFEDELPQHEVAAFPALAYTYSKWLGCLVEHAPFVTHNINVYYNVYYWFRVVFIHLIPCSVLVILNGLLVQAMRLARRRRLKLLSQNRKSECRRLAESNLTTMMLVAVVGLFLVVEVPLAGLLIVLIVDNTFDLDLLDEQSRIIAPLFVNLCILLSYPLNFFVYCGMSRQFRDSFRALVGRGTAHNGIGRRGPDCADTMAGATTICLTKHPETDHAAAGSGQTATSRLSDAPTSGTEAIGTTCFVVGRGGSTTSCRDDNLAGGDGDRAGGAQYVSMTRLL